LPHSRADVKTKEGRSRRSRRGKVHLTQYQVAPRLPAADAKLGREGEGREKKLVHRLGIYGNLRSKKSLDYMTEAGDGKRKRSISSGGLL